MRRLDGGPARLATGTGPSSRPPGSFMWTRVTPVPGQTLDLLHSRVVADFAPHVHESFAIGACIEGIEAIGYRGGTHYSGPGTVVVLEPGEPHSGGPAGPGGFVYRVMYPTADLLADGSDRPPVFPRPVVTDPGLALELLDVHTLLARPAEPLEAESRLSALLGELVRRHASSSSRCQPAGLAATGAIARQVMNRLADQLTCPPALAELAADAGLSRYQLLRAFRAEVGMPPYAWLAQHRVARARLLLERGHSLGEAAILTGFADQAHLTRWFRRVVGITPGAYRNSVQDTARWHG
ncbi:MAG: AraC family transcriptional regulator [Streptosporangiaceae bacterium]